MTSITSTKIQKNLDDYYICSVSTVISMVTSALDDRGPGYYNVVNTIITYGSIPSGGWGPKGKTVFKHRIFFTLCTYKWFQY